jgi:hypothetical protein
MWHRVPGRRAGARIEAGGSVELRLLFSKPQVGDDNGIPSPVQCGDEKRGPEEEKTHTRDLTTGALIEAWGVSPRKRSLRQIQSPRGATAAVPGALVCRRPYGALGWVGAFLPGAHAPGYMPLPLTGQISGVGCVLERLSRIVASASPSAGIDGRLPSHGILGLNGAGTQSRRLFGANGARTQSRHVFGPNGAGA